MRSDGARDPFAAAREMAVSLGAFAPPVPTIELSIERSPSTALARFRLGQVPAQGWVPSMAFVGRRAVGKSTLALALADFASTGDDLAVSCAQVSWGGSLIAFDTPGLRAAGRPELRAQLRDALSPDPPDLMIAVFSVTEVDAGIDDDVDDLLALSRGWTLRRRSAPALLAVLHRIDELPPFDRESAADDPDRALAIEAATRVLRARLSPLDGRCPIVATSAVGGVLDPAGASALEAHARALLSQRVGSPADRVGAFERCLGSLRPGDDPSPLSQLRRRWEALDEEARGILLHPRGWAAASGGRSERG
ncbi:MAG: hypothetical protein EPO40_26285 [Myxococcaceae bacterium]|nr:MAG: hypothetical protein EPO40_26285 [Myxococcaceae bacterium]